MALDFLSKGNTKKWYDKVEILLQAKYDEIESVDIAHGTKSRLYRAKKGVNDFFIKTIYELRKKYQLDFLSTERQGFMHYNVYLFEESESKSSPNKLILYTKESKEDVHDGIILESADCGDDTLTSLKVTAEYIFEVLQKAINQAHSEGYIFGDIKPENIVVCGKDVRLIDIDTVAQRTDADRKNVSTRFFRPLWCVPSLTSDLTKKDNFNLAKFCDLYALSLTYIIHKCKIDICRMALLNYIDKAKIEEDEDSVRAYINEMWLFNEFEELHKWHQAWHTEVRLILKKLQAVEWWENAANKDAYKHDNIKKAVELYEKATKEGVTININKAVELYEEAAVELYEEATKQGHVVEAIFNKGYIDCFVNGPDQIWEFLKARNIVNLSSKKRLKF